LKQQHFSQGKLIDLNNKNGMFVLKNISPDGK